MSSSHSLYKHPTKLEKADGLAKTMSSMQRKVNYLNFRVRKQEKMIKAKKIILNKHGELFHKLVQEGKVDKEYCRPYLLRYSVVLRSLK